MLTPDRDIKKDDTLRWYLIQPNLNLSKGDILLLFDCCFAGQAARGGLGQKFELLAAASMNLMTPGPKGPFKSFTMGLMEVMPVLAKEPHGFLITKLQEEMIKKELGLKQQSFYTTIAGAANGSIRLKPLPKDSDKAQAKATESFADLELLVSFPQRLSSRDLQLLFRWLTANRPPNISYLHIQNVILNAEAQKKIGQCCLDMTKGNRSRPTTSVDVRDAMLDIESELASLDNDLTVPLTTSTSVAYTLENIQCRGENLRDALEDYLSEFDHALLQRLLTMPEILGTELETSVSLRLILTEQRSLSDTDISDKVSFNSDSTEAEQHWRRGKYEGSEVLIEYWYPESGDLEESQDPLFQNQLRRITTMLSRMRQSTFSTLQACGLLSELLYGPRFGVVYRIPEMHINDEVYTLYDLFEICPLVPLELRFKLAWSLSRSLLRFHAIGWLHKDLKSANVVIFGKRRPSTERLKWPDVALTNPYLCGFDMARPQTEESNRKPQYRQDLNIYRHPDRWGDPGSFTQRYDIYALVSYVDPYPHASRIDHRAQGILLIEIGLWKHLKDLDPRKKGFRQTSNPEQMRRALFTLADDNLAHRAGIAYSRVARSCLQFEPQDSKQRTRPSSLKFLRANIVGALGQLCEYYQG